MKKFWSFCLIVFLCLFFNINSFAHSGNLDSLGGHHNNKEGNYHYHEGTYAGWVVKLKGDNPNSEGAYFDPSLIYDELNLYTASPWAYDELNLSYKSGLLKGIKNMYSAKFNESITREEFAKLLINSIEVNYPNYKDKYIRSSNAFNDLNLFKAEVGTCYQLGIINGYNETTFKPKNLITREEMACMLYRYIEVFTDLDLTFSQVELYDQNEISEWAVNEVKSLVYKGIIKGIDTKDLMVVFGSKSETTIEQAIILLYRTNNN